MAYGLPATCQSFERGGTRTRIGVTNPHSGIRLVAGRGPPQLRIPASGRMKGGTGSSGVHHALPALLVESRKRSITRTGVEAP